MSNPEIRSVIVPLTNMELLIPNASVAEIMNYQDPQLIEDTPAWILGNLLWRGWQVPLISFSVLAAAADEEKINTARVCVTKCLIGNARMPYFAILTQAFPRLTTISASELVEVPTETNPIAVAGRVIVDGQEVVVPDLDRLGHLVAHAAFGALPLARQPQTST